MRWGDRGRLVQIVYEILNTVAGENSAIVFSWYKFYMFCYKEDVSSRLSASASAICLCLLFLLVVAFVVSARY